jgi:hypothetical protein
MLERAGMFCRVGYLTSLFSSDQAGTGVEYTHRALAAMFHIFKIFTSLQFCVRELFLSYFLFFFLSCMPVDLQMLHAQVKIFI